MADARKSVRVLACLPLDQYKRLMQQASENLPKTTKEEEEEEEDINFDTVPDDDDDHIGGAKPDSPPPPPPQQQSSDPIDLILMCVSPRGQKTATVILHYLAALNGQVKFNASTGALILDGTEIQGSCFAELVRSLCSPSIYLEGKPKSIPAGMRALIKVLALRTGIASSMIKNTYYSKYLSSMRRQNRSSKLSSKEEEQQHNSD